MFGGKQYTKYEALQRQRRLETTMRAQRQQISLLKEGGADENDIITARGRYRVTSAEYARFSKAMDLPQQRERVTVDGLGNIGVGKYKKSVDKSAKSGIIKDKSRGMSARSFDNAKNYAKKHLGASISELSSLPLETVYAVNNALYKIYREAPELKGAISEIIVSNISEIATTSIHWVKGEPKIRLKLSSDYFADKSVKEIEEMINALVDENVFTGKKGIYGILKHESVHIAEFKRAVEKSGANKDSVDNMIDNFELTDDLKTQALKMCEIEDDPKVIAHYLSNYANYNSAEFLAEAYSSNNNNELVKAVKKLLKKKWGI